MKHNTIKTELKSKGWSYRKASILLQVGASYLCRVANGIHQSRRLELKIQRLPNYADFIARFPTFFENKRRHRKISNN